MLRNKLLIPVLAVLLIAVAAYNYTFFSSRRTKPAAPAAVSPVERGTPAASPADPSRTRAAAYKPQWLRDPFWYHDGAGKQPVDRSKRPAASSDITLEGTMSEQGKGYAIIDGQVLEAGDTIRGYTIVSIGDRSIVVKNSRGTRTLTIAHDLLEKEN